MVLGSFHALFFRCHSHRCDLLSLFWESFLLNIISAAVQVLFFNWQPPLPNKYAPFIIAQHKMPVAIVQDIVAIQHRMKSQFIDEQRKTKEMEQHAPTEYAIETFSMIMHY